VISTVGRRLYETFFEGYTRKQWGVDPSELDKSVTARVPARASLDDRYFLDRFQAMPRDGYTRMFERMVDHEGIDLALGTDFHDLGAKDLAPLTIYTGPIDRYFGHRFGHLPYRSLEFRHETHDRRRFQEVATVNYPDAATPWTRITEYKHLTGQSHPQTSITYEYARAEGDPFYPVPRAENRALYRQYEALARTIPGLHFVGRLGTYQYYNMDQVVAQALATFRRLEAGHGAQVAAGA
jgi:UDP-galactopyranose mutase